MNISQASLDTGQVYSSIFIFLLFGAFPSEEHPAIVLTALSVFQGLIEWSPLPRTHAVYIFEGAALAHTHHSLDAIHHPHGRRFPEMTHQFTFPLFCVFSSHIAGVGPSVLVKTQHHNGAVVSTLHLYK